MLTSPFIAYDSLDAAMDDCQLNAQAEVLAYLLDGKNVMLSGPAGSGKTTVINYFIAMLLASGVDESAIAVTASTGIAATLIGGQTLHSWSGLGVDKTMFTPSDKVLPPRIKTIRATKVLIIDEISMLPAWTLTSVDRLCRHVRDCDAPFGGIQVVFIGDFMQLPPVVRPEERKEFPELDFRFALAAPVWEEAELQTCFMDKKYRSTCEDLDFVLDSIIARKVDGHAMRLIEERMQARPGKDQKVMRMFTTNRAVNTYNDRMIRRLPGPMRTFFRRDSFTSAGTEEDLRTLVRDVAHNALHVLEVKPGAQVMLTANLTVGEKLYPNGEIGVLEEIVDDKTMVVRVKDKLINVSPHQWERTRIEERYGYDEKGRRVTVKEKILLASVKQFPIKPAYAITIHKSQGQTFNGVEVDLSKIHTAGLGYVALSRVRSLDSLYITGFSRDALDLSQESVDATGYILYGAMQTRANTLANLAYYTDLLGEAYTTYVAHQTAQAEMVEEVPLPGIGPDDPQPFTSIDEYEWIVLRVDTPETYIEQRVCLPTS